MAKNNWLFEYTGEIDYVLLDIFKYYMGGLNCTYAMFKSDLMAIYSRSPFYELAGNAEIPFEDKIKKHENWKDVICYIECPNI